MAASLLCLLVILMAACLKAMTLALSNYCDYVHMLSQANVKHASFEIASSCGMYFKLRI